MALSIVHYNSPILRQKGRIVTEFGPELAQLANDMVATMHQAEGIGLAAQQVGLALQVCVMDLRRADPDFHWEYNGSRPPLELFMPITLVNPVVQKLPSEEVAYEEGCLSFPKIRGDVVRPDAVAVTFLDVRGQKHELKATGLLARCIQHEVDHLNGVLFIDRMAKLSRLSVDRAIKDLAKRTKDAETGA